MANPIQKPDYYYYTGGPIAISENTHPRLTNVTHRRSNYNPSLYNYVDHYTVSDPRMLENIRYSPIAEKLFKGKIKPGEILTDRDIIDSPNVVNNVDSLAIWNSTINKLQQHEIAKQNAKKESGNSADTNANNIPIVPYEPLDLTWKYDVNNFPVLPMIAASGSVNSPDTPANVGNEDPKTPNNANNPPTGTNTGTKGTDKKDTGNPIGNSVKEKVNQDSNKGAGTTNVGTNTNTVKTAEQIAYDRARNAANTLESSAIIQDYYNKHGINKQVSQTPNTPQVTKTALSEPQRDYYRYLTGYHRMSPNQAILSMGLDPTKYSF